MAAKQLDTDVIKGKLLQGSFMNNGPSVLQLSDPIVDTPMVVTLDKLRSYDFNPRLNRNPLFDELKASILNRGLEAPPPITRRPGEEFYIIRNGGNTRLAILNELWRETHDEQFFRIHCLFRPWPERGDIVALTGHLAENDMHGELTFVERALGVERAKEFYELEANEPVSQRELARKLAADGYPVSQPHISKMQDTVQYLLPAIPSVLYSGLGKPQIERLIALRRSAEKTWVKYANRSAPGDDFKSLFIEVLSAFDEGADFKFDRFQDELIHQMQQPLGKEYNWLKLDILDAKAQPQPPDYQTPAPERRETPTRVDPPAVTSQPPRDEAGESGQSTRSAPPKPTDADPSPAGPEVNPELMEEERQERIQAHIVSPIPGLTPRTQAMKKQLAQATGEPIPDFEESCLHSIPVQVGGLHPVSDIWYIERQIDGPEELRHQIFGLISEVANEVCIPAQLYPSDWGIGFRLEQQPIEQPSLLQATTMNLLEALSGSFCARSGDFAGELGGLMLGRPKLDSQVASVSDRLSDQALVKIFRVVRLSRRLIELETSA